MKKVGQKIHEGLRKGDLNDLVLPMISVDEYSSKITPKAVVIGFYVRDVEAANDLNRFLQKSATPLLDTDVSPAPDQHGYYLVFVEIMPNRKAGIHLELLLGEVGSLVGVENWAMRVRNEKTLADFNPETFHQAVKNSRQKVVVEHLTRFFSNSDVSEIVAEGSRIRISTHGIGKIEGSVRGIGSYASLIKLVEHDGPDVSLLGVASSNQIATMLGEGWSCQKFRGGCMLIMNPQFRGIVLSV